MTVKMINSPFEFVSTLIDCQDFKLLHAHWWFWEEGVVLICPQSSGENCFFVFFLVSDLTSYPCVSVSNSAGGLAVCMQSLLQDRDASTQLMLDADYRFQVTFPFRSSIQALELLQVPNSLNLTFLTRTWRSCGLPRPDWIWVKWY